MSDFKFILYRSVALEVLYKFVFGSVTIGGIFRPEIHEKRQRDRARRLLIANLHLNGASDQIGPTGSPLELSTSYPTVSK
jgi:hypothetical protein